jgi:hypothetical protein
MTAQRRLRAVPFLIVVVLVMVAIVLVLMMQALT